MVRTHKFIFVAILASVTLCACATDRGSASDSTSVAQIRSAKDLENYLQTVRNSPLDYMSPAAKQRFVSSLVFTARGLASFRYTDLQDLSATQVYQILALFGTERASSLIIKEDVPGNSSGFDNPEMPDYACSNVQAACKPAIGELCLSNCSG
jgi:hypothetical protein